MTSVLMPDSVNRNEDGAILILALIFMLIVTFAIFGLVTFGGVGILNSTNLKGQRSLEYAADGAITAAIQAVRYSPDGFSNPQPVSCLPDGAVLQLTSDGNEASSTASMMIPPNGPNGVSMAVDCIAGLSSTTPQFTRVVTFYACPQTNGPVLCVAGNSVVAATVDFEDVTSSGVDQCSASTDTLLTCGVGEEIATWVVQTSDN
jgi:hypothetical protein